MDTKLCLHEEVMLLALGEETGKVAWGTWCDQALGGAVIAELRLAGRIRLEGIGKEARIEVVSTDPLGDELLDEWLAALSHEPESGTLVEWASKVSLTSDLRDRVARSLVRRGVLRVEESKVLFVFARTLYPELDPEPEREVRARLRDAIFTDTADVEPRTVALLSIAKAAEILPRVFDASELKARHDRIEALANGEVMGDADSDLAAQMVAVITAAAIVPAVIT